MKKRVWLKCGRPWQCPSHSPSFKPKLRAPLQANSFLPLPGEGTLGLWERAQAACGQQDSEGTHTLEQTRFAPRFLYFKWDHSEPRSTWHVWGCAAGLQVPTAESCSPTHLHWFPPCLSRPHSLTVLLRTTPHINYLHLSPPSESILEGSKQKHPQITALNLFF